MFFDIIDSGFEDRSGLTTIIAAGSKKITKAVPNLAWLWDTAGKLLN